MMLLVNNEQMSFTKDSLLSRPSRTSKSESEVAKNKRQPVDKREKKCYIVRTGTKAGRSRHVQCSSVREEE